MGGMILPELEALDEDGFDEDEFEEVLDEDVFEDEFEPLELQRHCRGETTS